MTGAQLSPFGLRLRRWRKVRRMSQLELAHAAGASPRHISFIETGRSRPGEGLVLRLAETLDVPLRERNELLLSAGLSPLYAEEGLDDEQLAPFRALIDRMLTRHEPYPAMVIDRWWALVRLNGPARLLFGDVPPGTCLVDLMMAPGSMREQVTNFSDVAWATVDRIRTEVQETPDDEGLSALLGRAESYLEGLDEPARRPGPVVCPVVSFGGQEIRTVTTIARFGTARSVTLDELRVELVYPADDAADAFFQALAAAAGPR